MEIGTQFQLIGRRLDFVVVADLSEQYGFPVVKGHTLDGKLCNQLMEQGTADEKVLGVWQPRAEDGETLILRTCSEDGPYVVFAREIAAKAA